MPTAKQQIIIMHTNIIGITTRKREFAMRFERTAKVIKAHDKAFAVRFSRKRTAKGTR
jgi:hypothetical protein